MFGGGLIHAAMCSGGGGNTTVDLPNAVKVAEEEGSVVGSSGSYLVTEYYSGNKQKRVRLSVYYFKTANEQLSNIYFLNEDGGTERSISFSNFYIG